MGAAACRVACCVRLARKRQVVWCVVLESGVERQGASVIKRFGRIILVLGMVLTTFSWLVPSASAAGATVPVCPADEMAVRAALIAARYGGTVLFTCDAYITLADTLLLGDVTLDGNGFDVTIDGNNAVGVFSAFGTVSLIGLHIVNGSGSTAGAIYADKNSTLRIANSTLSGNHVSGYGGAIFASGGSITIVDSTISDNVSKEITPTGGQYGYGGAIFGSGTLVIDRSTINNNVSMHGGAINGFFSRVTISNSTLSGNSADIGGAIMITSNSSVLEITNSTLAGNSARYGSTIMFDAAGTLNATNSIFAGGGPSTICAFPYAPTVNDLGGNLANDSSCGIGTFASLANLKLGPLADNGGPTQTIALGNGSVAIGAGDPDVCNADPINGVDQRGYARLATTCDSGAFDTGTPPDTTTPVITPTISGTLSTGGWYTSDVTVTWSVVDDESAISASTGCDATTVTADTTVTTFTCEATSAGGNSSQSVTIKRDATAPVVSVTGVADGAVYTLGDVPAAGCTTTDATSGVATAGTISTSGGPVGEIIVTCEGAVDYAGNVSSASATYTVQYDWQGFATSTDSRRGPRKVLAGSPITVIFMINGNVGLDAVESITTVACNAAPGTEPVPASPLGRRGSLQQGPGNTFIFWWHTTRSMAGTCQLIQINLADSTTYQMQANFLR